jgi:hypothetical protein
MGLFDVIVIGDLLVADTAAAAAEGASAMNDAFVAG